MVIISTIEIEYIAFIQATQQALWLTKFFNKVGLPTVILVVICYNLKLSLGCNLGKDLSKE